MKPTVKARAPRHSPKMITPIKELPINWSTVDSGIVLETPIRLNEINCPIWPIVHKAPQRTENQKPAVLTVGWPIIKATNPTSVAPAPIPNIWLTADPPILPVISGMIPQPIAGIKASK